MIPQVRQLWKAAATNAIVSMVSVLLLLPKISQVFAEVSSPKLRDGNGREWVLKEWKQGEKRPYPQDLYSRERAYRSTWGENWYGPTSTCRILSPGDWQWEAVVVVPPDLAAKIRQKNFSDHNRKKLRVWGGRFFGQAFIWAPGAEGVTDVFGMADTGLYHYDPATKKSSFIGNLDAGGFVDGSMERARLSPIYEVTLDPVTGRIFFIQSNTLRYVEKLQAYRCKKTGRICWLPSVLDFRELFKKVKSPFGGELEIVLEKGTRTEPLFVVRTNRNFQSVFIPGPVRGRRPLITPDGKGIYFSDYPADVKETRYEMLALYDLETGHRIKKINIKGIIPKNMDKDGPGSHGGNCVGFDGIIYTSQHGGCCGPCGSGAGRMFSIAPESGTITSLYDSMKDDGTWSKTFDWHMPVADGPADATTLLFTSTLWQVQCPRTGAIINGGWDLSGIRRYHDGFVTSIVHGEEYRCPPRPGWTNTGAFYHGNSSPSIAPNGDLYVADDNWTEPRILRIYRTDWPKEQPEYEYAEKYLPKSRVQALMLEYAESYIADFNRRNKILEQ